MAAPVLRNWEPKRRSTDKKMGQVTLISLPQVSFHFISFMFPRWEESRGAWRAKYVSNHAAAALEAAILSPPIVPLFLVIYTPIQRDKGQRLLVRRLPWSSGLPEGHCRGNRPGGHLYQTVLGASQLDHPTLYWKMDPEPADMQLWARADQLLQGPWLRAR